MQWPSQLRGRTCFRPHNFTKICNSCTNKARKKYNLAARSTYRTCAQNWQSKHQTYPKIDQKSTQNPPKMVPWTPFVPKGCPKMFRVWSGTPFCTILGHFRAPFGHNFSHVWALLRHKCLSRPLLGPQKPPQTLPERCLRKTLIFSSLWDPPGTSQSGFCTVNTISNSMSACCDFGRILTCLLYTSDAADE